ncbi:hypothetical protein NW765_017652 [Fusarium oxysporum]|nr:hypothetical protein NW765_017652 [Fusarium oxysporum]KAJ4264590.1 hypothetical protein NW764_015919 [Fusarium oxysporum]
MEHRMAGLSNHEPLPYMTFLPENVNDSSTLPDPSQSPFTAQESILSPLFPSSLGTTLDQAYVHEPINGVATTSYIHTDLPSDVRQSLLDTFFEYCHDQPYSYFDESSFRRRFSNGLLPEHLVLAVHVSALRFSNHEYFGGSVRETARLYAQEAARLVMHSSMQTDTPPSVHEVQTLGMLAIIDFTAGSTSQGWLKIGLATRICQDLHLTKEPDRFNHASVDDEQRRTFWSIYLLDKLVSCGKDRRPVILDEDCHVSLEMKSSSAPSSSESMPSTLRGYLRSDAIQKPGSLSEFSLTILAASVLCKCARTMLHDLDVERCLPWEFTSEFNAANSLLLLIESRLFDEEQTTHIDSVAHQDGASGEKPSEHVVFARCMFHLCYCLLNHPFLLRMRLKRPPVSKPPANFIATAFRRGLDHACQLVDILLKACAAGAHVSTSFYAYCACLAGSIIILHLEAESPNNGRDLDAACEQCFWFLNYLEPRWDHATKIRRRLQHLKDHSYTLDALLVVEQTPNLDPVWEDSLWVLVDYDLMCQDSAFDTLHSSMVDSISPASQECFEEPSAMAVSAYDSTVEGEYLDDLSHEFLSSSGNSAMAFLLTAAFSGG